MVLVVGNSSVLGRWCFDRCDCFGCVCVDGIQNIRRDRYNDLIIKSRHNANRKKKNGLSAEG